MIKVFGISDHKIRQVWAGVLCLVLVLYVNAYAQLSNKEFGGSKENSKPILREEDIPTKEGISFAPFERPTDHIMSDSENIKQTVSGLSEAGYALDEIADFLEKQEYSATSISIACLDSKFNFSGKEIYKALIKAGFSKMQADSAVPAALRSEEQIFYKPDQLKQQTNSQEITASKVMKSESVDFVQTKKAEEHPFINNNNELRSTISTLKRSSVSTPQVVKVLKELGVSAESIIKALDEIEQGVSGDSFDGLGEWNSFQTTRYNSIKSGGDPVASQVELVKSLVAAGYEKIDILKCFVAIGEKKEGAVKDRIIRTMSEVLINSGMGIEEVIGGLKDNGVSDEDIINTFISKPVSLVEKVKSGTLFNGNVQGITDKIIRSVVQGKQLKPVVENLQHSGYDNKDIVESLKFLNVSEGQTAQVMGNNQPAVVR